MKDINWLSTRNGQIDLMVDDKVMCVNVADIMLASQPFTLLNGSPLAVYQ